MNVSTAQAYSILAVLDGAVLNKDGSLTVAYTLQNPEAYSFDEEILNIRHDDFFRAFKYMPNNSFVHKQDVFLKKKYASETLIKGNSFISKAERKHFKDREYLEHECVLAFTLTGLASLEKSYIENPIAYKKLLAKKDKETLSDFLDGVEQAVIIINNMVNTSIKKMDDDKLQHYLLRFVNGFVDDDGLRDIRFSDKLEIGHAKGSFFSISDETYLPDEIPVFTKDTTLPIANSSLVMAFQEKIGVHILCNHIYNQILFFEGDKKLRSELDQRVRLYGRHQKFSQSIESSYQKLKEFEKDVITDEALLCRAHFNIMVWDENPETLEKAQKTIKEALSLNDIRYYDPSHEGLRNIFLGSIIGREAKLVKAYWILTDLATALTLLIHYSVFQNDEEGVLFHDRLFQVPIRKDIWDAKKKRINARNALIVASTGGGKSATVLNIVQQLIEEKYKVIVVEFGRSFEQLCKLYPEVSTHIDYDGQTPLGINPFFIETGTNITIDKLKTLTTIVLKFWRVKGDNANQNVSLTKIVGDYYAHVFTGHSFPDFYSYVKDNYEAIFSRQEISPEHFDTKSFLHVCSEFMLGGVYENVCKTSGSNEDKIRSKDFVLFEMTKIKKDPFLVSLVMSILFDTIENKILSDRSTRGILIFDEYAETQSMVDDFSGEDVHRTAAFCYQKLRKENGAVWAIVQSPAQLPANEYTRGIIANTQLLYVLPTNEVVYDDVIELFSIKNKSHINLMRSIKNNFSGKRPHSEIFMRFADSYATVSRLEFSEEKFLAFQTDGEDWQKLSDDFKKTQNMETSINNLQKEKYENSNVSRLSLTYSEY